jgi:uncharacterized protein involved in exopolysaccharide biosynthesis
MIDRAEDALNGGEGDEEGGFNLEVAKEVLGFVARAPRRHPMLAGTTFFAIASLGVTVALTMPKSYNSTAHLLSQKTAMLPALGNPNLPLREGDFAPTKDLADVIRRRENVEEIVKEGNLVERFKATRSPALQLKDRVYNAVLGPQTDDQRLHGLVGVLEKKLTITSDDNSVTISVDWPDPSAAYTIVTLVQKNLIEAKYDTEVAMIEDTISLLEDHAKQELDQVDSALADFKGLQSAGLPKAPVTDTPAPSTPSGPRAAPAAAAPTPRPRAAPDADLTDALQEKRQQIKTFEDDRKRTLDGLKQQLMQAQLTLTAMHPTVVALQQKVDDFSQPSPELARLKAEERAIVMQIGAATDSVPAGGAAGSVARTGVPGAAAVAGAPASAAPQREPYEDPALAAPHERLSRAIGRYQDVMARIEGAKLQLDISRTAYQYRYRVITPAEVAIAPKKPISQIVGFASVLGAILIAYLAAALSDWSKGVILETWQVRRMLKLDVLTELDPPT